MSDALEENIKKIEVTRERLEKAIAKIDKYNVSVELDEVDKDMYKRCLDSRDSLAISLNYFQNQVLIEQNNEIIKYLNKGLNEIIKRSYNK